MKHINKIALLLSFFIIAIMCSSLSMMAVSEEYRFTPAVVNPWNGVEGISYTIQHFLNTGLWGTWFVTAGLLLFMWWRLYALLNRFWRKKADE